MSEVPRMKPGGKCCCLLLLASSSPAPAQPSSPRLPNVRPVEIAVANPLAANAFYSALPGPAREQLVKYGAHLTEEPKLDREGKWQPNLSDPDQRRIEFMEFAPKEKPCCPEFTGPHPKP